MGRRESEPHSAEITYIHDVLSTNFPESRTIWDLPHYFKGEKGSLKGEKIDIQFDISFFKDFSIPYTLSSYKASEYEGRIPDMVINILSKSTWKTDLSENVDICRNLKIPVYVLFSPYKVTSKIYHLPFLRVYVLNDENSYKQGELYNITLEEGGEISEESIIDINDILPLRLGLMQLDKKHKEDLSLFRLVFIDPSELKILPIKEESLAKEKGKLQKDKKKLQKDKEKLAEKVKKYRSKFGDLK